LLSFLTTILTFYIIGTLLNIPEGFYLLTSINSPKHSDNDEKASSSSSSASHHSIPLFLGVICFLHFFTLLNYLRYNNRFTSSTIILWSAFFKVQRIIVSILPVAFGFMLLGITVFGNSSESFGSLTDIFITMYSVMNCDSIWKTFNDTNSAENVQFIGKLSLFLFLTSSFKSRFCFFRVLLYLCSSFFLQELPMSLLFLFCLVI
jgi:hypothetical protein